MHLLKRLRTFATTIAAAAAGVVHMIVNNPGGQVELKAGDPAPDFELAGSDGRSHRLKDLAGRPVVLAWFPKAFTGG